MAERQKKSANKRTKTIMLRFHAREKQSCANAAELAAMAVTTWMRTRLLTVARQELEGAGRKVPLLEE
jgi:uncharacterized protein (DUF1778 family)